jgi:hypothetical protein
MKEAYAVRPRSAVKLLSSRLVEDRSQMLSELARLGARLIIQRAVEEESVVPVSRRSADRRSIDQ